MLELCASIEHHVQTENRNPVDPDRVAAHPHNTLVFVIWTHNVDRFFPEDNSSVCSEEASTF